MKLMNLKLIFMALLTIESLISCQVNNEDDIDMSNIDFSNIENLYAQPLPVIQKCVQGKWKWYASIGGDAGFVCHNNRFVIIKNDHYVIEYENGIQNTVFYEWKKRKLTYPLDFFEKETYAIIKKSADEEMFEKGWFFASIKNDTLVVHLDTYDDFIYDIAYEFSFARIDSVDFESNNH